MKSSLLISLFLAACATGPVNQPNLNERAPSSAEVATDCNGDHFEAARDLQANGFACLNGHRAALNQAVVLLENNKAVQLARDLIDKNDSRLVGASLVARLHAIELQQTSSSESGKYNFWKNGKIQLVFPAKYAQLIKEHGFLNQFETGAGTGTLDSKIRIEDEISGLRLPFGGYGNVSDPFLKVRPKYAFLGLLKKTSTIYETDLKLANQYGYGNAVAVLKDELKNRSTFTTRDSFGIRDIAERRHTFYWQAGEHDFSIPPSLSYWEVQVWGAVTPADVDHLIALTESPEAIEQLKAFQLPVYQLSEEFYPGGAFKEGKLIYTPAASNSGR